MEADPPEGVTNLQNGPRNPSGCALPAASGMVQRVLPLPVSDQQLQSGKSALDRWGDRRLVEAETAAWTAAAATACVAGTRAAAVAGTWT